LNGCALKVLSLISMKFVTNIFVVLKKKAPIDVKGDTTNLEEILIKAMAIFAIK